MATALLVLADGFEEIEAVAVIDILRRGGVQVTVAGLSGQSVEGAHSITIQADTLFYLAKEADYDAVILPGGEPGTTHLKASLSLSECIKAQYAAGKLVAAICAAPTVLEAAGIMAGKRGTSYPSYASDMTSCLYSDENIVVDDTIITSRGPGTAMAFGYQILESLKSKDVSNRLREAMIAV